MTIDLVTPFAERFSHVHRSHGAVKRALLSGLSFELKLERAHLL